MWQFLQGWEEWDGVTGSKEGQKVGRQELGHLAKSESRSLILGWDGGDEGLITPDSQDKKEVEAKSQHQNRFCTACS